MQPTWKKLRLAAVVGQDIDVLGTATVGAPRYNGLDVFVRTGTSAHQPVIETAIRTYANNWRSGRITIVSVAPWTMKLRLPHPVSVTPIVIVDQFHDVVSALLGAIATHQQSSTVMIGDLRRRIVPKRDRPADGPQQTMTANGLGYGLMSVVRQRDGSRWLEITVSITDRRLRYHTLLRQFRRDYRGTEQRSTSVGRSAHNRQYQLRFNLDTLPNLDAASIHEDLAERFRRQQAALQPPLAIRTTPIRR